MVLILKKMPQKSFYTNDLMINRVWTNILQESMIRKSFEKFSIKNDGGLAITFVNKLLRNQ